MKLTLEPTEETMRIDGQDLRVWIGADENGTPVRALVRAVSPQTHDKGRLEAFDRALRLLPPIKQVGMVIDHRFVADDEATG